MLIGDIWRTEKGIVLRDVDGSEITLTAKDALDLAVWVAQHLDELEQITKKEEQQHERQIGRDESA